MAETNFTPGPWRIDDCGDVRSIEDGEVIAVVLSDTDEFKTAHLIAAAPDMFEALRVCAASILDKPEHRIAMNHIDAALAKARGEAV